MNFLFTSYFYPLASPILLSGQLKFSFDNPRTKDEVEYAKKYIRDLYESNLTKPLPIYSKENIVTLEGIINNFRDSFSENDAYIKQFFVPYKRKNIFDVLAKMWVIARFDDERESVRLKRGSQGKSKLGEHSITILEDDHPIVKNSSRLVNYSYLLSLLSHTEAGNYLGRNFVLDPDQLFRPKILEELTQHLIMLQVGVYDFKVQMHSHEAMRWIFWHYAIAELEKKAQVLENAFRDGLTEKLIYIGGILKIVDETRDDKVRLLMLTSIIELLLTRNPDTSRFNVEDSINRQFQLKASILVYLNDKNRDIEQIKKRLKVIYQQRSNIAHGNFGEINSFMMKLKKENHEEYFDDFLIDLYMYIRAILEEYLKDRRFVEFLKTS